MPNARLIKNHDELMQLTLENTEIPEHFINQNRALIAHRCQQAAQQRIYHFQEHPSREDLFLTAHLLFLSAKAAPFSHNKKNTFSFDHSKKNVNELVSLFDIFHQLDNDLTALIKFEKTIRQIYRLHTIWDTSFLLNCCFLLCAAFALSLVGGAVFCNLFFLTHKQTALLVISDLIFLIVFGFTLYHGVILYHNMSHTLQTKHCNEVYDTLKKIQAYIHDNAHYFEKTKFYEQISGFSIQNPLSDYDALLFFKNIFDAHNELHQDILSILNEDDLKELSDSKNTNSLLYSQDQTECEIKLNELVESNDNIKSDPDFSEESIQLVEIKETSSHIINKNNRFLSAPFGSPQNQSFGKQKTYESFNRTNFPFFPSVSDIKPTLVLCETESNNAKNLTAAGFYEDYLVNRQIRNYGF